MIAVVKNRVECLWIHLLEHRGGGTKTSVRSHCKCHPHICPIISKTCHRKLDTRALKKDKHVLFKSQDVTREARMDMVPKFVKRGHCLRMRVQLFNFEGDGVDTGNRPPRICRAHPPAPDFGQCCQHRESENRTCIHCICCNSSSEQILTGCRRDGLRGFRAARSSIR